LLALKKATFLFGIANKIIFTGTTGSTLTMMPSDHSSEGSQQEDDSMDHADSKVASIPLNASNKMKATLVKAKKKKKRKPKDMPKRPLSAYNIFFREERARILESWEGESTHSVNLFSVLGKKVAQRWKGLDDNEKQKYNVLATAETERYNKDMEGYHLSLAHQSTKEDNNLDTQKSATFSETIDLPVLGNTTTGSNGLLSPSGNLRSSPLDSLTQEDILSFINTSSSSNANVFNQIPNLYQLQLGYNLQQRDQQIPNDFLARIRLQQLIERERLMQLHHDMQRRQLLHREIQSARVADEILRSTQLPPTLAGHNGNISNEVSDFLPSISAIPEFSSSMAAQASIPSSSNQISASMSQSQNQSQRDEQRLLQLLRMQLQDFNGNADSKSNPNK
jgi:HMG (high mobility group) box